MIGPGDEIVVMLWGETEFNREYIVTRDGYLFHTKYWSSFREFFDTLSKLEKKLFNLMKKYILVWIHLMEILQHFLTLALVNYLLGR